MSCRVPCIAAAAALLLGATGASQTPKDDQEALALLAKIDGKATFDPDDPKRVIGIDI